VGILLCVIAAIPGVAFGQSRTDDTAAEDCENVKEPIAITFCELVKAPARYHGKVIRVRTTMHAFGDGKPTLLFNESCDGQVRLLVLHEDKTGQVLDRYLRGNRLVDATVVGTFEQVLMMPSADYFRLTVQSVSDVGNPRRRWAWLRTLFRGPGHPEQVCGNQ
jgi:hypothetical protein